MENLQEQLDVLRSDVNQMAIKLDRVLEVLTNLNLLPQHVLGSNAAAVGANPSTGLSSSNVIWPPDGLPVGCTSSRYTHPSNEGPAAAQVIQAPMGTNAEFFASQPRAHQVLPRVVVPQKSQDSPKNVYQSSGMMTVDPGANFANVHVGETYQKLREIMDKLSNVSKVQFCSSMPVHTSYSQQPQGCPFPKAMQMPMNPTPQRTQQQPRRVLDPIPMTYSQLLPYLVHSGMVTPKAPKPMTPPFPAWFICKSTLNKKEVSTMSSHQVISKKFGPIWGNYLGTSINQEGHSLEGSFSTGKMLKTISWKLHQNPGVQDLSNWFKMFLIRGKPPWDPDNQE
ncbi:unnamed protein product [Trifolium pratense]|uniref:Uncharacterized protein n=1 Tax=Trifolium pratense TaxID=57577 RepID=A0ACB0JJD8_TRIPR|nr:unnamed protein product [Trifolium pratense]